MFTRAKTTHAANASLLLIPTHIAEWRFFMNNQNFNSPNNQNYNNQDFSNQNYNPNYGYQNYNPNPNMPHPNPPTGDAVRAMVFGILSIILGEIPFFSIVGIIFGALARKWSKPIINNYPYTSARLFAKAGRITGSIGLGLSIGFTIFWMLYFVLIFGMLMAGFN